MTLARDIGNIVGKSEQAVKFHAARMMLEVLAGRKLSRARAQDMGENIMTRNIRSEIVYLRCQEPIMNHRAWEATE